MKLIEAGFEPFSLRLRAPLVTSRARYETREGFRVRLDAVTEDGQTVSGEGDVTPLVEFGTESLEEARLALQTGLSAATEKLPPATRCGVEAAWLDLEAKASGRSVAALLEASAAAHLIVPVAALLPSQPCAALVDEAMLAVAAGHTTLKIKVGLGTLAQDVERVRSLRAAVGPQLRLRVDANGAWSVDAALTFLKAVRGAELELCEQPAAPEDLAGLAALKRAALCPIAADESVPLLRDNADRIVECADILVLKPAVLGGLRASLELARVAASLGVRSYASSVLEGPVGRASIVHLAAALPDRSLAAGIGDGALFEGGTTPPAFIVGSGGSARAAVSCPVAVNARRTPDAPAIRFEGATVTWSQLDADVGAWQLDLDRRGIRPGDRVCLLSRNRPEVVALWFALMRRGAALVPLNTRTTPTELAAQCEIAGPNVTFADDGRLNCVPLSQPDRAPDTAPQTKLDEISRSGSREGLSSFFFDPLTLAAILFTSGTTGTPKAAQLTVGNFVAAAEASRERVGGKSTDRWLASLPLFHIGGLAMAFRCAQYGAALHLLQKFDAEAAVRALRDDGVTHASFVPTTLQRVLDAATQFDARGLRAVLVGGGPVTDSLIARARALGIPAVQTYGLTEACSQVCTEEPSEADGTTAGPALAGVEVRIVDEERTPLPVGAEGEIEVRGASVMRGYLGHPPVDGWLRTHDLGALDSKGRLRVFARRSDLILSGGENVYPAEIEALLTRHPAVRDAGVAGVADAQWGQVPLAAVVVGDASTIQSLGGFCRELLPGFKVPRRFVAVQSIPRNANGKLDRRALRKLLEES